MSNAKLEISSRDGYMDWMGSKGFDDCGLTLSFLGKVMRFLKISSGSYNLQQSY